jgi:hypothetical protein
MSLSGVQNALSGFPARPPAGWPLKTCLHAEVRRFDTQACGNDKYFMLHAFETASRNKSFMLHFGF